jgi:hypothetical protein
MTSQIDHNKLLKNIAKERLKPYGIFQQGQSRTFLYDRGWFIVLIEFQPSSWSQGTYLNIGVDFNFYPRENFAFSYGYREKEFEEFKDEKQFGKLVNELCDLTILRVQEIDHKYQDIWTALQTVDKDKGNNTWRLYDVAVLNALTSNYDRAQQQFIKVSNEKCEYEWEIQRKQLTDEILTWQQNTSTFADNIKNLIIKTRQLKKLPAMTHDQLMERKGTPNK